MRRTIEITRHNCPSDGDSITAEVTLDVSEGTVTHVGTKIIRVDVFVPHVISEVQKRSMAIKKIGLAILERDCDPVAMAIEKLTELQGNGGAE